jgi:hypothetical protein
MQTLVKHDERDVIFFCGAGEHCGWTKKGKGVPNPPPAAVRFSLAGDILKATVLWSGIEGKLYGGNKPWMFYDGGRLYAPGADALTGKPAFGSFGNKRGRGAGPVPASGHLLQAAGGHLYGFSGKKEGIIQVCTLDGKPVSECKIPLTEPKGAELELIRTCERQEGWPVFSKGRTFTFGPDCIVVRGMARLYCFGK